MILPSNSQFSSVGNWLADYGNERIARLRVCVRSALTCHSDFHLSNRRANQFMAYKYLISLAKIKHWILAPKCFEPDI